MCDSVLKFFPVSSNSEICFRWSAKKLITNTNFRKPRTLWLQPSDQYFTGNRRCMPAFHPSGPACSVGWWLMPGAGLF
jgi:hypothetical protein